MDGDFDRTAGVTGWNRLRQRTYEVLGPGEDRDRASRIFDTILMVLITANVAAVMIETVRPVYQAHRTFFLLFDTFSVVVFSIEYVLRVWCCTADPRFSRPVLGRLRYMVTPMAVVDLLAILPFYLPFLIEVDLRVARSLRLFRLLRLLKLARYSRSLQGLQAVWRMRREELVIAFSFAIVLLLVSSSVLYYVEHEAQPEAFSSIPAAMWWGVATLTTVGYGDVYPITPLGRVCGAVVAVVGVGLFALPAGILASGLSEQMDRQREAAAAEQAEPKDHCPHCGKDL